MAPALGWRLDSAPTELMRTEPKYCRSLRPATFAATIRPADFYRIKVSDEEMAEPSKINVYTIDLPVRPHGCRQACQGLLTEVFGSHQASSTPARQGRCVDTAASLEFAKDYPVSCRLLRLSGLAYCAKSPRLRAWGSFLFG